MDVLKHANLAGLNKGDQPGDPVMEQRTRETIEKVIAGMSCPKAFKCYRSNLSQLCKAKDIGLESFLQCLEDNSRYCEFSIPYGNAYFCKCPVRIYIAKQLSE